jgi:hypothetical protein
MGPHVRARAAHIRKARRAAEFARDLNADKATRAIWREHARQHVKAARRENWLAVGGSRRISASLFLRKTVGAGVRAH